jgi:hypothetical protein
MNRPLFIHPLVVTAALSLLCSGSAWAQPTSALVYTNRVGDHENRFVVGPADTVSGGRYRLLPGEAIQFDRLTYERDVEFRDGRDNAPTIVRGWVYKGTDKTENSWRVIFGKEPNTIAGTYPVYYTHDAGPNFKRWLLPGGTRRAEGTLTDQIQAVLWANQLDADRLGLEPFDEQKQSPISVTLAWRAIEEELNELLNRHGTSLSSQSLLRGPDGRLHMNVRLEGDNAVEVADALGIRNNVELDVARELRTRMIVTTRQLAPQYLTNGRVDLRKVQGLLTELIGGRSEPLQPYNFSGQSRTQANGCEATSTPWQLLTCGDEYCQFWRIRFGFRIERKDDADQYELMTEFDIGECRADERQFGTTKVIWKTTSKDASEFDYLSSTVTSGPNEVMDAKNASIEIVRSIAPGYSVYDPLPTFSLKQILDQALTDYVAAIVTP